jgi:hypothetical protein
VLDRNLQRDISVDFFGMGIGEGCSSHTGMVHNDNSPRPANTLLHGQRPNGVEDYNTGVVDHCCCCENVVSSCTNTYQHPSPIIRFSEIKQSHFRKGLENALMLKVLSSPRI